MSVSEMKKLTVFADVNDADLVVRRLMDLKCVEIRNVSDDGLLMPFDLSAVDRQKAEAEKLLADIRTALPHLAKYTHRKLRIGRTLHGVDRAAFCRDGRLENAKETVAQTLETLERIEAFKREQTDLRRTLELLEPWIPYEAPLALRETAYACLFFGSVPAKIDTSAFFTEMEDAGAYVEKVSADEHSLYVSVLCLKREEASIVQQLDLYGFLKSDLPLLSVTPQKALLSTRQRIEAMETERLHLEECLRNYAKHLSEVEILFDIEATTVNACIQKRKLAATKNCAVLQAWIPSNREECVAHVLSEIPCAYDCREVEKWDKPPVLLCNNSWTANFEWVVGMYSYPRYGSFDPTFVMSLFYFLIFGLMFADVGYGGLLTVLCFGVIRVFHPKPALRRMLAMFGFCGVSCACMGVLFGGWFGDLPTAVMSNLLGLPIDTAVGRFFSGGLWLNPIDHPMAFLIISLGVGALHLIVGMAIRLAILWKKGRGLEGICTIVPFWVLFIGFGLFLYNTTVAVYVTVIGAILVLFLNGYGQKKGLSRIFKGLGGLYSLINYASDLLSYSRILALGMVAGVVAKVINMITALGSTGAIGFLFMLVILLLGHALNIGINILGTFVHTARLQYIEFFGKFYEDGGDPFEPVRPSEEYSEDIAAILSEKLSMKRR